MVREEQLLVAVLAPQPVVDRALRDRGGHQAELRRRAGDPGELLETRVGQGGGASGRVVQYDPDIRDCLDPGFGGLDGALLEAVAPSAGRCRTVHRLSAWPDRDGRYTQRQRTQQSRSQVLISTWP